jgi:hypothetical protein
MISANLEAICSSDIATVRSHSTPSVIVEFNVDRYSSDFALPKIGMDGRRRHNETPAKAMIK